MTEQEKAMTVLTILRKWAQEKKLYAPECIYQRDSVIESLPELVDEMVEAVGDLYVD
jgi:hypothetical protein